MIHFLGDIKGYYIYDSVINDITVVSRGLVEYLKKPACEKIEESIQDEIDKLKEKGFLQNIELEIENPAIHTFEFLINRGLSNLVLQVTQNCNFRCEYCAFTHNDGSQRNHSLKKMSKQMALKAVDFLHIHSIDSKKINIGFYGGEPLLEYELIKDIVKYSEEKFKGKELTFTMTTNATLLDDEKLQFINKHNFSLMISLDGIRTSNDKNRHFKKNNSSTFEIIKEKILLIKKNHPNILKHLSINMVMDPKNDFELYQKIYEEIPVLKEVYVRAEIVSDYDLATKNIYTEDFVKEYEYYRFLAALEERKNIQIPYFKNVLVDNYILEMKINEKMLAPAKQAQRTYPSGVCIPGYLKLFVDVDGFFRPCEKVSETCSALEIGNIENGFNVEKCKQILNIAKLTEKECVKCWAFRLCTSCERYCASSDGLSRERRLKHCEDVKSQIEMSLLQKAFLKNQNINI